MNTVSRSTKITIGVLILCAVAAPLVLGIDNSYLINILCSYCYFGIMCCSLNLLLGYTGQISMGHAAFMMIGAYTYGILNKYYGVHFLLAVIAAVLMSFAAGLLLGAACCKLNAIFLAMTTVGFYKAVSTFIVNEGWLTGGATGIPAIAKWSFFGVKLRNWHSTIFLWLSCFWFSCSVTVWSGPRPAVQCRQCAAHRLRLLPWAWISPGLNFWFAESPARWQVWQVSFTLSQTAT